MFLHAEHQARFVSRTFDKSVYSKPTLIDAARRFLDQPSSSLDILIEDASDAAGGHPFIDALSGSDRFTVRLISEQDSQVLNVNFALFDELAYRLEPDKKMGLGVVAF